MRAWIAGSASPALTALWSLSITSTGVLRGAPIPCQPLARFERLLPNDRLGSEAVRLRMGIDRHKTPRTNMRQWEREGYASITCHLASHNFIAGFRVEYG